MTRERYMGHSDKEVESMSTVIITAAFTAVLFLKIRFYEKMYEGK